MTPGGRTGVASTGEPTGEPSVVASWTVGWIVVSARRPAGPNRARMRGLGPPAQTADETTWTWREAAAGAAGDALGAELAPGLAAELGAADDVEGAGVGEDDTAGSASMASSVAVIASAVVPNGK